jgi:hypothetical protein
MKASSRNIETHGNVQKGSVTVLMNGFRHPNSDRKTITEDRDRDEPPEIGGRACTWDAISDT